MAAIDLRASAAPLQLHFEASARLTQQDRTSIERLARRHRRELPARRDLVREGERPRSVILVLEGWASRYKQLPDGRRQIVHFLIPGDLGDAGAAMMREMDHSIASVTRLTFAEIPITELEALMATSASLMRAFWWSDLVAGAVSREWTMNVGQRSALERLAHLFCELFIRLGSVGLTDGVACDWPLTQGDLADAAGLTPVHVNRTLQELRRERLIALQGRRLMIPDLARLMSVAMFRSNYLHFGEQSHGRHSPVLGADDRSGFPA